MQTSRLLPNGPRAYSPVRGGVKRGGLVSVVPVAGSETRAPPLPAYGYPHGFSIAFEEAEGTAPAPPRKGQAGPDRVPSGEDGPWSRGWCGRALARYTRMPPRRASPRRRPRRLVSTRRRTWRGRSTGSGALIRSAGPPCADRRRPRSPPTLRPPCRRRTIDHSHVEHRADDRREVVDRAGEHELRRLPGQEVAQHGAAEGGDAADEDGGERPEVGIECLRGADDHEQRHPDRVEDVEQQTSAMDQ